MNLWITALSLWIACPGQRSRKTPPVPVPDTAGTAGTGTLKGPLTCDFTVPVSVPALFTVPLSPSPPLYSGDGQDKPPGRIVMSTPNLVGNPPADRRTWCAQCGVHVACDCTAPSACVEHKTLCPTCLGTRAGYGPADYIQRWTNREAS